jgi:hypothetical protein
VRVVGWVRGRRGEKTSEDAEFTSYVGAREVVSWVGFLAV